MLQRQVVDQGSAVQRPGAGGVGEERLDLGSEGDERPVGGQPVVERLDAERITRENQAVARLVVDGQREHPAQGPEQLRDRRMAAGLVQPQNRLGVAACPRRHALEQRALRKLAGVVDLAVVDDAEAPVRRPHRLMPSLPVEDRQSGRAERELGADERAGVIGSTMLDGLQHPLDQRRRALRVSEDPGDPAHADLSSLVDVRDSARCSAQGRPENPNCAPQMEKRNAPPEPDQ